MTVLPPSAGYVCLKNVAQCGAEGDERMRARVDSKGIFKGRYGICTVCVGSTATAQQDCL